MRERGPGSALRPALARRLFGIAGGRGLPAGAAALALVLMGVLVAVSTWSSMRDAPLPARAALGRSARIVVSESALWAGHVASRTVTRLTIPSGARVWQTALGCEPATLAFATERVYAACSDTGEVVALDAASGAVVTRRTVGHGAFGILVAGRVYVTLAHDDALVSLRPDSLAEIDRATTLREPRGIALKDGRLYVVHQPDASLRVFDPRTLAPLATIEIGQQAGVAESVTPHPTADRVYVPHQRLNVTNLARKFDDTVFPVVSAIDTRDGAPVRREALALDSVDTPVGMPLAVAIDSLRGRLHAVNAASDDVSVVDLGSGIGVGHVVVGQRPRDVALSLDGSRLYTLDQLSNGVTVIDATTLAVTATLPLADDPRPAAIRLGERIFTTSRPTTIARDHWISCASCHLDGGLDGRTWLGTDDGPRNTPTLRSIRGTEPFHWSGTRENTQAFQKTFTGLMAGTGLSQAELDALAAFIDSLRPIASPRRAPDGSLTATAVAGAAVFRSAGCVSCHAPPLFTDRLLHDVGTGAPFHDRPAGAGKLPEPRGGAFKTPPLRELWLTAPYLHDGRAATLRDAIRSHTSSALTEPQLADLEAFLLQLPLTDAEAARLFPR